MTQEGKELLLRDLCARLPYGVWLNVKGQDGPKLFDFNEKLWSLWIEDSRFSINDRGEGDHEGICEIKPYLRLMSSMTDEEKKEHELLCDYYMDDKEVKYYFNNIATIDWYHQKHFDCWGLIKLGLALVAPEGMYEY